MVVFRCPNELWKFECASEHALRTHILLIQWKVHWNSKKYDSIIIGNKSSMKMMQRHLLGKWKLTNCKSIFPNDKTILNQSPGEYEFGLHNQEITILRVREDLFVKGSNSKFREISSSFLALRRMSSETKFCCVLIVTERKLWYFSSAFSLDRHNTENSKGRLDRWWHKVSIEWF